MYQREDVNVGKLLKRLPKAVRSKVQSKECWTIFKKYDAFQREKLEGSSLWKALLEALPESFAQAILNNQYGWSLQQDSVHAFTGCGRDGEPAVSFIKFPEYVKFTLALILHKYSVHSQVLDCKMALKPQELDHSKRKTKVVASLGPASWSEEMIPKMIEAGTDIFRLNCSHRRGGDFERVYPLIRRSTPNSWGAEWNAWATSRARSSAWASWKGSLFRSSRARWWSLASARMTTTSSSPAASP
ncbi:unnamed protein product [Effrenium voratum]|nr:unnamed protein product [Effrenium voratum]